MNYNGMQLSDSWNVRLREAWLNSGLQQKDLAFRAQIPPATLNRLVNADNEADAKISTLLSVVRALGLRAGDVLDDDAPLPKSPFTPYDTNEDYRDLIRMIESIPRRQRGKFLEHMLGIVRVIATRSDVEHSASVETDIKTVTSRENVSAFPERTVPRWTPEFPIEPEEFNESGAGDFPREYHAFEREDLDEAGVESGEMTTPLLSGRDARNPKLRVVNVRNDDVAPLVEGSKIVVDVTVQNLALIDEGEIVVAYRKDTGICIGRLQRRAEKTLLSTDTGEAIDLGDGYRVLGPMDHVAYLPGRKRRRQ